MAYLVLHLVLYFERFILALHFSSHRRLYATGNPLNYYASFVVAPFFGVPPGLYYYHHVVMHHCEGNIFPYDASSTEPYQRDRFLHFIHYWLRFLFVIWFELVYYLALRRRYKLLFHYVGTIVVAGVCLSVCWSYSPSATFWVFTLPQLLCSLLLMFGNWSQHVFVHPTRRDAFGCAYNLVASPLNARAFCDGYHLVHHLSPMLHWSELPKWFLNNKERLAKGKGLTFRGLDFFEIGFFAMTGQLGKIASSYVQLGDDDRRSKAEIEQLLREWLKPIDQNAAPDTAAEPADPAPHFHDD